MISVVWREIRIELQTTAPHTPEQNSVAERWNRTVVELSRAMLFAHNLPTEFPNLLLIRNPLYLWDTTMARKQSATTMYIIGMLRSVGIITALQQLEGEHGDQGDQDDQGDFCKLPQDRKDDKDQPERHNPNDIIRHTAGRGLLIFGLLIHCTVACSTLT